MTENANAFSRLPSTAQTHFSLYFFAAVYRLVYTLLRTAHGEEAEPAARYPFLGGYLEEMMAYLPPELTWRQGLAWWEAEIRAWEAKADMHLPLLALPGLDTRRRLALVFAGLVEEDSRFGTVIAELQAPLAQRRPGLELVAHVLGGEEGLTPDPWGLCRPLLASGLVTAANEQDPRSEWVLQVAPLLWDVVRGETALQPAPWCRFRALAELPEMGSLLLPAAFHEKLAQVPPLLQQGTAAALVIRGIAGSERGMMLGAVARALGRNLVEVARPQAVDDKSWRQLGPLCAMSRSLPLLRYALGPGETAEIGLLPGYDGPLGVVLGREGGLRGEAVAKTVTLHVPLPDAALRRELWQQGLNGTPVTALDTIAARFHLPAGHIKQIAGLAVGEAALAQQPAVGIEEVRRASRSLNRQMLDTLAAPVEADGHWGHLVVSEATASKLAEVEQRCRQREQLLGHLGPAFGRSTNRGVRALFSGGSGTGKTMAARILAAELGMDLYRVDLSAVVNKYIGETEKNLHQVLSTAESLDVILLLDEGDALLGSRTEVRSATDRYANLETNFLLQRLESYEGIVLITSNAAEKIDSAFQRRLDVVVPFVAPQAEARWQIWQLHLPADHRVEPAHLEDVAARCAMTGGQIRNAALHATLLALNEGSPVTGAHLQQAVQSEYRKAGAHSPLNDNGRRPPRGNGIDGFLEALA
jgi:hypothetical protein